MKTRTCNPSEKRISTLLSTDFENGDVVFRNINNKHISIGRIKTKSVKCWNVNVFDNDRYEYTITNSYTDFRKAIKDFQCRIDIEVNKTTSQF